MFFDKGAWVVATPDGIWRRDSHYWRKFIGWIREMVIFIRDKFEACLRNILRLFSDLS